MFIEKQQVQPKELEPSSLVSKKKKRVMYRLSLIIEILTKTARIHVRLALAAK